MRSTSVELEPGRTLLDLIGLESDLSDALGARVEAITVASARPRVLASALREAIRIV
jgi:predicted nucleotidyltransferase